MSGRPHGRNVGNLAGPLGATQLNRKAETEGAYPDWTAVPASFAAANLVAAAAFAVPAAVAATAASSSFFVLESAAAT